MSVIYPRIYFQWKEPRRGILGDHPLWMIILFMLGGCFLFAGAVSMWKTEAGQPVIPTPVAIPLGASAFLLLIGWGWLCERYAGKREDGEIVIDERGIRGRSSYETFSFEWANFCGFEFGEVGWRPNQLTKAVYFYPTGARTCVEWDKDGEILFEERCYYNVPILRIAPEVHRAELESFLTERLAANKADPTLQVVDLASPLSMNDHCLKDHSEFIAGAVMMVIILALTLVVVFLTFYIGPICLFFLLAPAGLFLMVQGRLHQRALSVRFADQITVSTPFKTLSFDEIYGWWWTNNNELHLAFGSLENFSVWTIRATSQQVNSAREWLPADREEVNY